MTPEQRKRRRRGRWITVGVITLLVIAPVAWWLYDLLGPNPPLVVSRETTYITEPLDENGLPDYERYLFEKSREGVTPENNAAVLFWEAMGLGASPEIDVDSVDAERIAEAIGLELPTKCRPLDPIKGEKNCARLAAWLTEKLGEAVTPDDPRVDRTLDLAIAQPWRRDEIPPLAAWVDENREALDLLVEASKRPEWFSPSHLLLDDERSPVVVSLWESPDRFVIERAAQSLATRATLGMGEPSGQSPLEDIQALLRLSLHFGRGWSLSHYAFGVRSAEVAEQATLTHLSHASAQRSARIVEPISVATIFERRRLNDVLTVEERMIALDSVLWACEDAGFGGEIIGSGVEFASGFVASRIDRGAALQKVNSLCDELSEAMQISDFKGREKATKAAFERIYSVPADFDEKLSGTLYDIDRRSRLLADLVTYSLYAGVDSFVDSNCRRLIQSRLVAVAFLLAKHRSEHGSYPSSLDEFDLEATHVPPTEVFHSKPFVYRKTDDGYLLYSVGANGVEDGGSNAQEVWGPVKFEGRSLEEEYWRNSDTGEWELSAESAEVAGLKDKVPDGADDIVIRLPIEPQPWPWEVAE